MKFAAIDVGSNAIRLLLSAVHTEQGRPVFKKQSLIRMPLRLGGEAFTGRHISPEKINQLVLTMQGFRHLMAAYGPLSYRACATSAMREAENGTEIIGRVKRESGIDLQIIDGPLEAEIISANHEYSADHPDEGHLYIDVGGGSTELTRFLPGQPAVSYSFKIGTIRLLKGQVSERTWQELKQQVQILSGNGLIRTAVGSGGNINKLHRMANLKDGQTMKRSQLNQIYRNLKKLTVSERILHLDLRPDRADVIVPAAEIYLAVLNWAGLKEIKVPEIGLVDGLIHILYREYAQNGGNNG
jgi:exopolyphosphatase/guanosine-5'-triphosphate,3'-diphosphate pyrophosphatase